MPMDTVIQQLEDSLDGEYAKALNIGTNLVQVQAPGSESVSTSYIDAAAHSCVTYNRFIKDSVGELSSYVDPLQEIQTAYANHDQAAIAAPRRKAD